MWSKKKRTRYLTVTSNGKTWSVPCLLFPSEYPYHVDQELVPIVDEIQPDVDTNFGYRYTQPAIEMGITVLLAVTLSYFLYLAFL